VKVRLVGAFGQHMIEHGLARRYMLDAVEQRRDRA
jgi:hypothetical protein